MPTPGIAGGEKLKTVPSGSWLSCWFKPRLDFLILFRPGFAVAPGLQSDEIEGVVTGPDEAEQAEANDAGGVLDTGRVGQDFLDLSRRRCRALERSRIGKLHVDEDVALVFIGQEARGQTVAKETRPQPKIASTTKASAPFRMKPPRQPDIDLRGAPENAIEPVEELAEQSVALLLWPEQQPGQRRAQRESVEGREDHRDGDGHGKLLIEPSGDARDEGCRHEDGRENQGDTDDRAGELFHGLSSRIFGSQTLLDVALHAFDDHNGIVHHQADGQHQPEHRERIDGEAEQREENKRAHQRNGHGQQRDQRSAPVLQEEVDHQDHQHDGDQEGFDDLLHAFGHRARLVKRYGVIHIFREALLHLGHQLADAGGGLDRIGAGQLVDGDDGGGLTIQAADNAVVLRAQFDSGDVFHSNDCRHSELPAR